MTYHVSYVNTKYVNRQLFQPIYKGTMQNNFLFQFLQCNFMLAYVFVCLFVCFLLLFYLFIYLFFLCIMAKIWLSVHFFYTTPQLWF